MEICILIDSSQDTPEGFVVGAYMSRIALRQAIREHLIGYYNIEEDEVDEHVLAVLEGDYDNVHCVRKVLEL